MAWNRGKPTWKQWIFTLALVAGGFGGALSGAKADDAVDFRKSVQPVLTEFCYDCHGDGMDKGGVSFDTFASDTLIPQERELWWKVLKNVRAGIMPPAKKAQPNPPQKALLEDWILRSVFQLDPEIPDPGRVTVRRLNRTEYRNTVRDLLGVEFDTEKEFPPDDTGHGFDNIADVLTVSPMLLEKYLDAAKFVIAQAVPVAPRVVAERVLPWSEFKTQTGTGPISATSAEPTLSYYQEASVSGGTVVARGGKYQVILDLRATERYVDNQFDYNKCRFAFQVDGKPMVELEFVREGSKPFHFEFDFDWAAGEHTFAFYVQPLTPDEKQIRSLALRLESVTVRGPMMSEFWVRPANYDRFFPKPVPESLAERRAYARELLTGFATRAFRRPVDGTTVDRLLVLAEGTSAQPDQTFEAGIAQAMIAVLASPRFLFREESVLPTSQDDGPHPLIDEFSLASRLSYFLWSSMPDAELFELAGSNLLRKHLDSQITRMLADPRSEELVRNFGGQWLQIRDIDSVSINARAVLRREEKPDANADRDRTTFRRLSRIPEAELTAEQKETLAAARDRFFSSFRKPPRADLDRDLRQAMGRETEMLFGRILREDRSLLELVDSDYTFLNEKLALHYGIPGVLGDVMRRVDLPPDSPRGGVLTQGTILAVTSNPTRTSPVKRGVFILENILGIPPAPPPPDIPPLEDSEQRKDGRSPTLKETLALHRNKPLCASCHDRMDPLGLALENFNAMGMWRESEQDEPIEVAGQLITGERFGSVQELKRILATDRKRDFFRCVSEKTLTYALGRGLDYSDIPTVDALVARLEQENARSSVLIRGVIQSAAFQKHRVVAATGAAARQVASTSLNP
jgi:hypothetical protein